MRWYQPIEDLTIAAQPFVSDSDELVGFNEWDFREGKFIPDWKQSAWLKCTDPRSDGRADDALRNQSVESNAEKSTKAVCKHGGC
jgi:hypothetical protein